MRTIRTSAQTLAPVRFSPRITCDPLGISCQLCYKLAEGWPGSLEGCSHDNGAAFNIPRTLILAGIFCSLAVTGCLSPITLNRAVTSL